MAGGTNERWLTIAELRELYPDPDAALLTKDEVDRAYDLMRVDVRSETRPDTESTRD